MYIGPWQEFKLAKILQLKEKVQREDEEDNQILPMNPGDKPKAHSVYTNVGNRHRGAGPFS